MCHTDYQKYVKDCQTKNVTPLDYQQWLAMMDDIYD